MNKKKLNLKYKRFLCLFSILLIGLAAFLPFAVPTTAASAGWIICYFTENPNNYDLHLAYSTDALHWTPLNNGNPVAHPTSGKQGLRDPFICKKQDGTFVVLATDMNGTDFVNGTSPYIHIWDSPDLCSFNNYRWVRMTATNMHAWAPEAFWDTSRGQYAIIWSGNSNYNKTYVNYTTDFRNVGTEQVFFDPGFSILDSDVVVGSPNYLYYKKEGDQSLYGAKSSSLNPGSFNSGTYTSKLLQGNAIEAPELIPNVNGTSTWYLYGDSYSPTNGVIYAWQTTNIGSNSWTVIPRSNTTMPPGCKHPGIVAVTADQMTKILAKWGGGSNPTPTPGGGAVNRIYSYNFPMYYIRHLAVGAQCRIDPNVSPIEDSQWRIVPGLVDTSCVSFESVNYPGYFLRHNNYLIYLNQNDGSSTFKADATFREVAGLKDSTWKSYQSYNFPSRYLRHQNYYLKIDPIGSSSSDTDKQDATFKRQ